MKLKTLANIALVAAGTRQRITTENIPCTTIILGGLKANTGKIYIGDEFVSATRGTELEAGETIALTADMGGRSGADELILSDFYFDGGTTGDFITVSYVKQGR